jgi:DNA-binding MarR family transcriptional regulator
MCDVVKKKCLELPIYGEKVRRLFLEIIKQELFYLEVVDINGAQAFILLNMKENVVTMSEVISRGYYVGSNASYNIKKLIVSGYMRQIPSNSDRRSVYLCLTDKGLDLCEKLESSLSTYIDDFDTITDGKSVIDENLKFMKKVETFWQDILLRRK